MKILRIDANLNNADKSYSMGAADEVIKQLQAKYPDATVETVNVFEANVPSLAQDLMPAWGKGEQNEATAKQAELLTQFKSADLFVVVAPMWNLSFPAELHKYFDNVFIAKETFGYTETGELVGMMQGKKAILVNAMGGIHTGTKNDLVVPHITQVLSFLGINVVDSVVIQGTAIDQLPVSEAVAANNDQILKAVAAV